MSEQFVTLTVAVPGNKDPEYIRENGLTFEVVGTSESLDRDNDRVKGALDYRAYAENPVVLWSHTRDVWIGATTKMERLDDTKTKFWISLPPASVCEFANEIARTVGWYGFAAVSIGFIPKSREANKDGGRDFYSPEITEISIVTVPSNREALAVRETIKDFDGNQRIKDFFALESESKEPTNSGEDLTEEQIKTFETKLEDIESVNKTIADIMSDLYATQALVLEKLASLETVEKEDSEPEQEEEEEPEDGEKESEACDEEEEKEKAAVVQQLQKLMSDFAEVKQNLKGDK